MTTENTTLSHIDPSAERPSGAGASDKKALFALFFSSWPIVLSAVLLLLIVLGAVFAPWLGTMDPVQIDPSHRLKGMTAAHWLGTDAFGRDVYSRVLYGSRSSLLVGLGTVVVTAILGVLLGVVAGYYRFADAIIMRILDGIMAIPGILLAIALVSISGASLRTVLVAIAIPEIPRITRLVRSVILSVRNEAYVEAAVCLGTKPSVLMWKHMLPNTYAPLIVQGTYIFASAILNESVLSFLGAGIPPEIPSWGNVMADGRVYFQLIPTLILYPGIVLSVTVLCVNILGDALRDVLDPRMMRAR